MRKIVLASNNAKKIKELKDNLVSLSDIVVLYRTNAQSRALEEKLMMKKGESGQIQQCHKCRY